MEFDLTMPTTIGKLSTGVDSILDLKSPFRLDVKENVELAGSLNGFGSNFQANGPVDLGNMARLSAGNGSILTLEVKSISPLGLSQGGSGGVCRAER